MFLGFKSGAIVAASLLLLSACSDEGANNTNDSTSALEASAGLVAEDTNTDVTTLSNIVDTAIAADTFTTLVAALQATDLDSVLADESSTFTVFAPTDAAFEKLGTDTINALLGDTDTLKNILLYHVVSGAAVASDAAIGLAGSMVEMANGDNVAVSLDDGKLFINLSEVVVTDVQASNGVIHVIDTVLIPPQEMMDAPDAQAMNIVDTAVAAGSFNVLAQALVATGLLDTLSNADASFTVFAPTDDAFAKLPEGTLDALLADPDTLSDILLYHVISGSVIDSTTAISLAGQSATMANGDDVAISLDEGSLKINDSTVTAADVIASNGIIHVIDTVLLPPADEPAEETPVQPEAPTGTILDVAAGNADFSILAAAVKAAGLDGALGHPGDIYTVFAPTNAAFEALGQDTIDALLADPDTLRDILLLHVLPGRIVDAATALTLVGYDIQAGNGDILIISQDGDSLSINGSNIVATDIQAVNGVIHVLDKVILPE